MTIKLLVADDSVTIQKVIRLTFSGEDAAIESVTDGDVAIDWVRKFEPDAVLADVLLPGYNGYELCERIKEDPELGSTPVILLVGAFEPFDEAEALRVRCDGHLTKPLDTSELAQTVQTLVGKKAMSQNVENRGEAPLGVPAQSPVASEQNSGRPSAVRKVDSRVRDSFLGANRILELFDPETVALANAPAMQAGDKAPLAAAAAASENKPSEEFLDQVAEKVIRKMSPDVIREVAWEVVPELSEVLIRNIIDEQQKSKS